MKTFRLMPHGLALLLGLAIMTPPAFAQKPAKSGDCRPAESNFFKDEALAMKLSTKLQFNKALLREKIEVKVSGGIATLSGNVSSPEHIALAAKLAAETDGIHCVNNFLKVGPPEPSPALGGG